MPGNHDIAPAPSNPAARAFISYAREQKPFVERLHAALVEQGHDTWVDWEGIPPTAEWMQEIKSAIEAADTFLFVITPEAVTSQVCAEEIAHAAEHNKRLVPLLRIEVDPAAVAPALRQLNWIFFRDEDDFDTAIATLIEALDMDLEWLRAHTQLLVRAIDWRDGGKRAGSMLRGLPLRQAEEWLANAADKEPLPTPLQTEYVLASRRASSRRQRWGMIALSLVLILVSALGGLAWYQRGVAEMRRAIAESRQLASESQTHLDDRLDLALLLSVAAFDTRDTLEARGAMLRALQHSPFLVSYLDRFSESPNIAFTSNGRQLITVGCVQRADGDSGPCTKSEIHRWDLASPDARSATVTIGHNPFKAALAPDDRTLAASERGAIRFIDIDTGHYLDPSIENLEHVTYSLAYSPDGTLLAAGDGDGAITMWDPARRIPVTAPLREHRSNLPVFGLAFSPDGSLLASAGADGNVMLWDTERWQLVKKFTGHTEKVRSVSFHPDGTILASSSLDGRIILWDITNLKKLGEPLSGHEDDVTAVSFARGGSMLVSSGNDRMLRLWDWSDPEAAATPLQGHAGYVWGLAISKDGQMLASSGADGNVLLWNIAHRQPLAEVLDGHEQRVGPVAFSPDGELVASAACGTPSDRWDPDSCVRSEILLWDARLRSPRYPLIEANNRWTRQLSFDSTGTLLASSGCGDFGRGIRSCKSGEVLLWDVGSGKSSGKPLSGHADTAWSFAFSPDGRLGASGSCARASDRGLCQMGEITLWDLDTRTAKDTFTTGASGDVELVQFGPGPEELSWVDDRGYHGTLALAAGRESLPPVRASSHNPIALSADGGLLAYASGDSVRIRDAATRELLAPELTGLRSQIYAVAFSPDGEMLAAAGCGYTDRYQGGCVYDALQLWRVGTRQRLGPSLIAPGEHLGDLAFSPDSKMLVSGSRKRDLVFWDLDADSWRDRACRIANRSFSAMEARRYLGESVASGVCMHANPQKPD